MADRIQNFFINVKSLVAQADLPPGDLKSLSINGSNKDELHATLEKTQADMKTALSNSVDTPQAVLIIADLISKANIHINTHKSDMDIRGLEEVARRITKIVGIFGLDANATPAYNGLGWASSASNANLSPKAAVEPYALVYQKVKSEVQSLSLHSEVLDKLIATDVDSELASLESSGTRDPEALASPYLRSVSRIRDELRNLAIKSESKKQILTLSDHIRDNYLFNLDVWLDDRPDGQGSPIKFIRKEELIAEREEKAAKEREREAEKQAKRPKKEQEDCEKAEKGKLSPLEMFRDDKFSAWDEDGITTKTKEGEEVTKNALKKLKKQWDLQNKAHGEWKAKNGF
jgi:cysteinyl-tRNA synthetase